MSSNDETTADNPQRIDLTQFEGNTEGPWIMDELGEIWRAVAPDAEPFCVMSFYHHPSIKPSEADLRLMAGGPALIAELKRCYDLIDSLQNEMYGFKEALWAEAICDESENVVGVEAYPGDQKREKKVFFISCDLVDEMYVFFQQHGKLDLSKNASQ